MIKKGTQPTGYVIIASAIIWGVVIYSCAYTLKETELNTKIQDILIGGALSHLLFVWAPIALLFKKTKMNGKSDA